MNTAQQSSQPRQLTPHELAGVVKGFREMRKWSQEQLAEVAGLSTRTVQRLEDEQPSSVDTRRALARAFDADDIDLFNKPYVIPTAEELAAEKERLEKENVTLQAIRLETGKQLAQLAEPTQASLFSEVVPLPPGADEVFARLTDYCREYSEAAELYSAVAKLGVYEELDGMVKELRAAGFSLVGATRKAMAGHFEDKSGISFGIVYVVVAPLGHEPEQLMVPRELQMG